MKLPDWLEEPFEAVLGVALLVLCLVPIALVAVSVMFPGWFLLDRPSLGCALTLEENKFIAPATNWVSFSLAANAAEDKLPPVFKENTRTQEVSLRETRIEWAPGKLPHSWVIEHDVPPGEWLRIRDTLPSTLSAGHITKRTMALGSWGTPRLTISWVCATPMLTLAFLIEAIGIMLALLDLTGQVRRFEAFLDRRRAQLHSWLFPWRNAKASDEPGGKGDEGPTSDDGELGLLPMFLTLPIMLIFYLAFDFNAWWQVFLLFIGSLLLAVILDFVLKWLLGSLAWLLWALLDKAPTGTVGGIGFALVLYGIGSNYVWG